MIIALCGHANTGKDTAADYLTSEHEFERIAFAGKLKTFVADVFGLRPEQLFDRVLKEAPIGETHDLPFKDLQGMSRLAVRSWADVFDMSFDERSPVGKLHQSPLNRYPFKSPAQILMELTTKLTMVMEHKVINHATDISEISDGASGVAFGTLVKLLSPRQLLQWIGTEVGRDTYQDIWVKPVIDKIKAWDKAGTDVVVTDVRFQSEAGALNDIGAAITRVMRPAAVTMRESGHSSETEIERLPYKFVLHNFAADDDTSMTRYWLNIEALLREIATRRAAATA